MPPNTNIVIKEGTKKIHNYAFAGCSGLKSITIPESVTSIGDYAFLDCTSLTSITIPEAVKSIGNHVFNNCPSLKSITCKAKTPPTLGFVCIDYKKAYIPLLVPANSIDAYKNNKEWAQFKNIQSM